MWDLAAYEGLPVAMRLKNTYTVITKSMYRRTKDDSGVSGNHTYLLPGPNWNFNKLQKNHPK